MAHELSITTERNGKHFVESSLEPGKVLEGPFGTAAQALERSKARSLEFDEGPGPLGVITITPTPRGEEGDDDFGARYAQTRQATEDLDLVDEAEAEFGAELDTEEAGQEPAPEPPKPKPETEEGGIDVGAVLSDIGRGVIELPLQTLGGLRDAAQETLEAVDSLATWLDTHVADLTVVEFDEPLGFPEVPQAQSGTGSIARGILQFAFGMIGAGKITGLSKMRKRLTKLQNAGRLGIQGAIADSIARDPNEQNLADLLRNPDLTPEQQSAIVGLLASDPDDNEAVARLKKAFEGFAIGALVDAVILGVGAIRAARRLNNASTQAQKAAVGRGQGRTQAEIDALVKVSKGGAPAFAAVPLAAEREPEREGEVQVASLVGAIVKGLMKAGVKEAGKEAPVFFSNAAKAIDGAKFEKGTAEQWLALSGLKKEEVEFSGLDTFLKARTGSVSKQEVLDFLDQNGVRLEETVKGGKEKEIEGFRAQLLEIMGSAENEPPTSPLGRFVRGEDAALEEITSRELSELGLEIESRGARGGPTKFATYQLPGGENYRELLITLPVEPATVRIPGLAAAGTGREAPGLQAAFTGGHWDEPNVLVHVRFNERAGAGDRRVLFIEEIQSDWHAKGRRQGYAGRISGLSKEELFNALDDAGFTAEHNGINWVVRSKDGSTVPNRLAGGEAESQFAGDLSQVTGMVLGRRDLMPSVSHVKVPDAPFKKSWHDLALKRMVRYAADNGFDEVAWTTGAQQADRYDLSKQVSRIEYLPLTRQLRIFDLDNRPIIVKEDIAPEAIEEFIGKDVAKKLLESIEAGGGKIPQSIEGGDLQVGGEGLKTFYDRMLPQTANRIGKKFGAKAGETDIGTSSLWRVADESGELATAGTREAAENLAASFRRTSGTPVRVEQVGEEATVHTFPITPKLKDEVLKNGLPLFSAGGAAGLAADQIDVSAPDILLSDPFVPGEPRAGEETQVAGIGSAIARGFRRAQAGADEITRQRTGPGAAPQSLVGDLERPIVELGGDVTPERFLDTTGAPRLPERAININLAKLDTTDDIKRAIDETAKLFGGEIDIARRGVQTNEATAALASDMGLTVEKLLSRQPGGAFNAETALAARRILASSASQLVDLAKKAADNGGDRELMAFRRAMVVHKAIQEQVSGLTAEAGRALQSFKILAGSEREMIRNVQEMIDASGGSGVSRRMARRLAAAAEDGTLSRAQLNEVVRKGALARSWDVFLEVWINSLLSGPQTQAVNILSNALVAAWQIPTRFIASKLPGGGVEGVAAGETKALLYGMIRGYSEGLILAGRAIRTGESTDLLSKIDLPQRRAISAEAFNMSGIAGQAIDLLGEIVRLPGRFLLAGDELFKSTGYRMELNARALRQAASEGLEGDAMARRMDEILRNPPEDIRLAAIDAGRYQTFTKPLNEGGQAFQRLVNLIPILRLLMPFIRTPVNIMKFVGEGTVLAPLSKNVRAEFAAGGARRQIMMAKIAMGSMASAFAADMAARGLVTGNGPSEPGTRKIWLTTHQPNSIKIGNEWVAFGRLEPLGAFMGIAADIQMIMGDLDEPARQNLATALVIAISKNVTSKTFLRGLSEAVRAQADPDRFGERYIQQLLGTAVPSIVAQVARVQDPVLRDVRTLTDRWCSRVPGCSKTLPPRRNIWGEVIQRGGGLGPDIISPIYTNEVKVNPVSDEILRLGVGVQMPSRIIFGVELTPAEYDAYSKLAGQSALKELTELMKQSDYKQASDGPDGLKALLIKTIISGTRAIARANLLGKPEFPDLLDRVEARGEEIGTKLTAPADAPALGNPGGVQLPASP